jgi:hypothetical protein
LMAVSGAGKAPGGRKSSPSAPSPALALAPAGLALDNIYVFMFFCFLFLIHLWCCVRLPPPVLAAALPSQLSAPLAPSPSRLGTGALDLERQRLDAGVRLGKFASSAPKG